LKVYQYDALEIDSRNTSADECEVNSREVGVCHSIRQAEAHAVSRIKKNATRVVNLPET
jgi:hypothetical protein